MKSSRKELSSDMRRVEIDRELAIPRARMSWQNLLSPQNALPFVHQTSPDMQSGRRRRNLPRPWWPGEWGYWAGTSWRGRIVSPLPLHVKIGPQQWMVLINEHRLGRTDFVGQEGTEEWESAKHAFSAVIEVLKPLKPKLSAARATRNHNLFCQKSDLQRNSLTFQNWYKISSKLLCIF